MSGRALRRWLLTLAAFFAVYFALRTSRVAMNALWYGAICPAEQWLGRLWGGWSLSVGEVLIVTAVCAALIAAANGIRYIVSARRKWRAAAQVLTTALCTVLTVYAGFCLLWGVGYNTDGFREKSGLTTAPVTADQLAQVTAYFADRLALSAGEVPRDGDGVCRLDYRQLLTGSESSLDVLTEEFPFLDAKTGRAKAFGCSCALSALRFTGFYFPFTGEANVNTDSPSAFLPATVCHEMAHQRGITAEEECNFIGILAATRCADPVYRYSGWLEGYVYLSNALYRADPDRSRAIRETLPETVIADLRADNTYWAAFRGPVSQASESVYDAFLKTNGDASGIRSYGMVTDLLVTYFADAKA